MTTPTLNLSQEQRQIQMLAPQLRQSLELLQAPMLELRALIERELQQNPTLEEKTSEPAPPDAAVPDASAESDLKELHFKEQLAALSGIDEEWRQYFIPGQNYEPYDAEAEKHRYFFLESRVQPESLQGHLAGQLALAGLGETDHQLGALLIGSINDDGYLIQPVEELAASAGVDAARLRDLLALIQDFDPVGVGARDLSECLRLQLERLGQAYSLAAGIVRAHLEELGRKRFKEIAQALSVTVEQVQQAAGLIATLEPRPGRAFSAETPHYILPDVQVEKVAGQYQVQLNHDEIPSLRISRHYRELMNAPGTTAEVKSYIQDRMRSGLFLIRSIAQRQQTLRRVARAIVQAQNDFLDHGIAHLKPLTMAEVARAVALHETTVCRCIANKYMRTPRGLFEMKFFFNPGLRTADGRMLSNKTIQDLIAGLVAAEDPAQPLSDHEIQEKLQAQSIAVARRTVAKYRIALKILPSHLRKSSSGPRRPPPNRAG